MWVHRQASAKSAGAPLPAVGNLGRDRPGGSRDFPRPPHGRLAEPRQFVRSGRVEDLFLPTDFSTPAAAPSDRLVSLTDPPNRDDQSDRAAVETLRNGGNVHALPAARMPSGAAVAATFRY